MNDTRQSTAARFIFDRAPYRGRLVGHVGVTRLLLGLSTVEDSLGEVRTLRRLEIPRFARRAVITFWLAIAMIDGY